VSAPGRGTRFEILLPSSGERAPAEQIAQHTPDREVRSGAGTVLFVEDESSLQVPVSKMLQRHGFSVMEAGNGVSAVELFRADYPKIDVVLLDMTLPGKSGSEVFSELLDIRPDVKVIFTTAYSQQTALNKLPGPKCWEFIQKPYQFDELLSLLQRVCGGGEGEPREGGHLEL
jgi:DNA-binding NtrC family response regulator